MTRVNSNNIKKPHRNKIFCVKLKVVKLGIIDIPGPAISFCISHGVSKHSACERQNALGTRLMPVTQKLKILPQMLALSFVDVVILLLKF